MRVTALTLFMVLAGAATLTSMDKPKKVSYQEMASNMKDAFNCGVVVEKYLHGSLKGKDDEYHQLRAESHCDNVETVLKDVQ